MEIATGVMAVASVVNVIVLIGYAWFTWGIWRETQQSGRRTEELARQSRDTFRLQLLVAFQEQIRWAQQVKITGPHMYEGARAGIGLMKEALAAAFPEEWRQLEGVFSKAAADWEKSTGPQR